LEQLQRANIIVIPKEKILKSVEERFSYKFTGVIIIILEELEKGLSIIELKDASTEEEAILFKTRQIIEKAVWPIISRSSSSIEESFRQETEHVLVNRKRLMALADKHKIIELEAIILEQDTKVDSEKDWVVLTETVAALNHIGNSSNQYIRSKYQTNLDWCPRDQGRRDFHMHTSISDGSLDIEDVVKELVKRVVKIAAITDHNALCAVDKYIETGARYGVIMIPAVEFPAAKKLILLIKAALPEISWHSL